ncbi:YcxB family protein, partial [Providencia stuartii]
FFFAIALLLLLSTEIDPSMARLQRMSGTALAFIVTAVMALLLSSVLEKYFMKKYEHKEQNDETYIRHIKINRYFIESIQDNSMYKVLWPRVNKVDVQEDLVFVQVGDNDFIIFPTRVFSSQEEFQQLYSFIKKQIERHTVP